MEDLTGMKFGRLTVIEFSHYYVCKNSGRRPMWKCKCECGNETVVRAHSLESGETQSCGCLQRELSSKRMRKHGGFGTRLYAIWDSMRQRCNNPNDTAYHNYGGRGIKICEEWDDFSVFREWAYATGYDDSAPQGVCTLDRIDVNGMYSPDNCEWKSMKYQSNNKRNTVFVEYEGVRKSLSEWADELGVKYHTLWDRYHRGLPPEKILKVS